MKNVKRPWGNFKQFAFNEKCTVKVLTVNPHQELSLQKHKRRKEVWFFLTKGYVRIGDNKFKVRKGDQVIIKKGQVHRAIARKNQVMFLEISFGKFSEKDEIRLEDEYGRVKK
ncbi:cupin domain-containing protein [Candidatus Pacearchaeota archaeon]|nr:cupin domain-containing protein [Candidatus Pacearchaeota archaeon]